MGTIVLLPGGFKPPHAGHIQLAKAFAKNPKVDEVRMLIGPTQRDGITREQSMAALKLLLANDPKIKVIAVQSDNPMVAAYDTVMDLPKNDAGTYALAASSKGEDFKRMQQFAKSIEDYKTKQTKDGKSVQKGVKVDTSLKVDVAPLLYKGRTDDKNGQGISASVMRKDLLNGDKENFATNYPGLNRTVTDKLFDLFSKTIKAPEKKAKKKMKESTYVICEMCGEKMKQITPNHLKYKHKITLVEYKQQYPNSETLCEDLRIKFNEDNAFKRKDVIEKAKKTKLDRYGNENYNNTKGWLNHKSGNENISKREDVRQKISEAVKQSYNKNPQLRELRSKTIGQIGKENFKKIRDYNIENGIWTSPEERSGFEGYRDRVRILTNESYTKNFYKIKDADRRSRDYHLDHKYSIYEGYRNGIPEAIISHWCNLEVVHHSINESKSSKSSMKLIELIELIRKDISENRELLLCGGTGGHMAHPFDLPNVNTGNDLLKTFIYAVKSLQKTPGSVKIDGVNASVRLVDLEGKKQFVMDRGSNKPLDVKGITKADLEDRFAPGHGMIKIGGEVLDIFNEALPRIQSELSKLGLMDNPNILLNIEYVSGKTNVQDYGKNFLAIHGLLEIQQVTEKRRAAKEIPYDKKALESMIKKMQPVAKKYEFEVFGSIPAKVGKEPNFSSELSKSYAVNYSKGKKETKSLKDWLKNTKIPKGVKVTLADGRKIDALSKQVFVGIKNGTPLDQLLANEADYKAAIEGFVTYLATMQLGDSVLKSMDSPLGAVEDQEGVVIRDKSIYDKPFKITGSFILRGLATSF